MEPRLQRIGAYCGLVMLVLLGIGMVVVAGLVPPPSPGASAQEILARYDHDSLRIRVGMAIVVFSAVLGFPFTVSISSQIARIEGKWGFLSFTQMLTGAVVMPLVLTFVPMIILATTYRPGQRSPETILAFSDFFWIAVVGPVFPAVLQTITIAIAAFNDKNEVPVFPRWLGYFNAWCAVLFVPGCAVMIFHDGPLAWNGVFAFWIPFVAFTIWLVIMAWAIDRAVKLHGYPAAEHVASPA